MTDDRERLRAALGDLDLIDELSAEQATMLLTAFQRTEQRRAADIAKAQRDSLKFIPWLLRGPVNKILFG